MMMPERWTSSITVHV